MTDTAAKRLSALHVGSVWRGPATFPDGTIGADNRAALAYLYSGHAVVVVIAGRRRRGGDDYPDHPYWRKKREEGRQAIEEGRRRRERPIPQVEIPEPEPLATEPVGPIIGEPLVLARAPPELELLAVPPLAVSGRPILSLKRRETDDDDDDETVLLMVA